MSDIDEPINEEPIPSDYEDDAEPGTTPEQRELSQKAHDMLEDAMHNADAIALEQSLMESGVSEQELQEFTDAVLEGVESGAVEAELGPDGTVVVTDPDVLDSLGEAIGEPGPDEAVAGDEAKLLDEAEGEIVVDMSSPEGHALLQALAQGQVLDLGELGDIEGGIEGEELGDIEGGIEGEELGDIEGDIEGEELGDIEGGIGGEELEGLEESLNPEQNVEQSTGQDTEQDTEQDA